MRYTTIAARKNPMINKVQTAYEELLPYKDRTDMYISFTDI